MASEGRAGLLPIPCSSREHDAATHLQASRVQAMAECSGPPQPARTDASGTSHSDLEPVDPSPPAFCTPIPMHASTPLILRKSRMRRRARTDLCGGRPVMVVPTATVIPVQKSGSGKCGHMQCCSPWKQVCLPFSDFRAAAFLSPVESVCSLEFASSHVMKIRIRRQLPKLPLLNPKSLERTPKNSPQPHIYFPERRSAPSLGAGLPLRLHRSVSIVWAAGLTTRELCSSLYVLAFKNGDVASPCDLER